MNYLGDFPVGGLVDFKWSTNGANGASITRATNGTVAVYFGNDVGQITDGVTDTEDFDTVTGIHHCRIDLSQSSDYAAGSEFQVVLSGATIDGQTVNAVLAHFSIERAGGVLALLKGTSGLSAIKTETASIQSDTNDIQTRLPSALVSGRMDASVGAMTANVVTAAATAADFGTEVAAAVWAEATRTLTALDEDTTTLDLDATIRSAVGLGAANLDTQLDALPTAAENADAVWDETLSTVLHATPGSAGYNMQIAGQILVDTTATGTPSTTQVQLSAGSAIDDFYNDQLLYIADGTGIGQVRPILDYAGATKTVTVSEAFAVSPASGDRLIIQTAHVHPTTQIADAVWANSSRTLTALDEDTTSIDIDATVRAAIGLSAPNLDAQLSAIDDAVDTEIAAIKAVTDKLDSMLENTSDGWIWTIAALQNAPGGAGGLTAADVWAHATRTLTAIDEDSTTLDLDATIRGAVGLASANLDTQLDGLPTAVENADALLNRDMSSGADSGSSSVRTPRQALRILRNKWSIDSDGLQTITKEDDVTPSWTQQLSTDGAAQPVTGTDPAGP